VAHARGSSGGEGLSLQTLVIAAIASGIAAVVTSLFWKGGTVITAAMTPVIVSIVKEGLARPIQSDVVRRSATSARRVVAGGAAGRTADAQRRSPAVGTIPTPPPPPGNGHAGGDVTQGDVLLTHPRRTYGSANRGVQRGFPLRGRPLKIAIATGLLAFVIAAVVLTVPELVFGGAVSSGHSTTLFGGNSSSKSDKKKQDQNSNTQTQTTPQSQTQTTTTPSATTPQATPTTQQQTPTTTQPQQTPGGGATPAPQQSPAPAAPSP
jgi:uncharacterized membrane protein YvlD (DUF360 family)